MHVFVTGATGLIGRAACAALLERGHAVTALSRSPGAARALPRGARVLEGDPTAPGSWEDALAACDACLNLAGESLDARWTAERKRRIRESRVRSTARVAAVVAAGGPGVLVSGSAVGFYGDRGDEELDERSAPGQGFLADVCREWEDAAAPAAARGRVVLLRTGLVFAAEGGALPRMALPFRLLAGGPLGDGAFWQPWIHVSDVVGLVLLALEDPRARGPLDVVSPAPVRNRELARALGETLRRPARLPTPAAAVRLALGELAGAALASLRVLPRRALELGYGFRFPELGPALRDLLR
ncbi:MAG TPA: TIGR01777 family oxidoreductase [Anaeromyxobacteraceae bacterium]|nr:TIGR01777 family oxidoreductase [Anaeromyxobacteraceae bacterium]